MDVTTRGGSYGSWRRWTVQAGVLAGLGLAFAGGRPPVGAAPPAGCVAEGMCAVKKPLVMFVIDYSTSMNKDFGGQTRWAATVEAVKWALLDDNGFLVRYFVVGLMRFGHDPDPANPGTKIANETSGLVDGHKIDVPLYDAGLPDKPYGECGQGDAIGAALDGLPAPMNGNLVGIGTWTRGALLAAQGHFAAALADHPDDATPTERLRSVVLVTDSEWTNPQGNTPLMPKAEDPALVAGSMFSGEGISTHVIALGDASGKMFADVIAAMGGTGGALDVVPASFGDAFHQVILDLEETHLATSCESARPRVMILLDASSSMLNLQAGMIRAPMGMGGWELARESLAGDGGSIFDHVLPAGQVEDLMHVGLAVFGGNMPDESKLVVQYGPCRRDNVKWALDPASSCDPPGCVDPYAKAPITWTFKDGSLIDPPGFDTPTLSHMPKCNMGNIPQLQGCYGSGTYTHLGLLRVQANIAAYKDACAGPEPLVRCGPDTPFVNVLILDGQTNSTQAQYTAPLTEMFAAGITTFVIGFGDGVDSPQAIAGLQDMADKGSGGALDYYDANNQAQLELALVDILAGVTIDPCCGTLGCAWVPPPIEPEPDPLPPWTSSTSDTSTGSSSTGEATSTGGTDTTEATSTGGSSSGGVVPGTTTTTTGETTLPTSGGQGTSTGAAGTTTTGDAPTGGGATSAGEASTGGSETTAGAGAEGGCGCRATGATSGWWVLAGLGWRRRRRVR